MLLVFQKVDFYSVLRICTTLTHTLKFSPSSSLAVHIGKSLLEIMEIKIPSKYKYKFILVKIRAEINDISNRKKNREAQLNQYWFFERIDNINKPLADAGWGGEKLPSYQQQERKR